MTLFAKLLTINIGRFNQSIVQIVIALLTTKELSKFVSLSFVTSKNISAGLVAHTSTKKVQKSNLMGNTFEVGLQNWLSITDAQWRQILEVCKTNVLSRLKLGTKEITKK